MTIGNVTNNHLLDIISVLSRYTFNGMTWLVSQDEIRNRERKRWTNGRTDGRTTTFRDELSLHAVRKNEAEIKFAHDRSSPRNQDHEMDEDLDLEHFL